jgi:hypothetical protein
MLHGLNKLEALEKQSKKISCVINYDKTVSKTGLVCYVWSQPARRSGGVVKTRSSSSTEWQDK